MRYLILVFLLLHSGCVVITTKGKLHRQLDKSYFEGLEAKVTTAYKDERTLRFLGMNSLSQAYSRLEDLILVKTIHLDMNIYPLHKEQIKKEIEELRQEQDAILDEIRRRQLQRRDQ